METLIVSAFFDINRGANSIKGMSRSNQKYFDYFSKWARIKNQLVVYTQPQFVDEVIKIRTQFGLKEKTIVISIEDIFLIEPEIYSKMLQVEKEGEWSNLRLHTKALSNTAVYDYIMLIKYWCMKDAVEKLSYEGHVVWMDFGFNHGDKCYIDENDFAFHWNLTLENGIHFFAKNAVQKNAMGVLLLQSDCIMGCPVIAHSSKCDFLWEYCKDAINALLMLDAIDDDQQLLLMAYKAHPKEITVHYSDWFLPIKEYGGGHLKVREGYGEKEKPSLKFRCKTIIARLIFFVLRDYSHVTPYDFGKRMAKYAKEHK